jgi:outer membrane protein assembly factor BamB
MIKNVGSGCEEQCWRATERRCVILACVLVGLTWFSLTTTAIANENWPQFRGHGALGVVDDPSLPMTWSTTDNVQWIVDVPGLGWSSPIVWDDLVIVTGVASQGAVEEPRAGFYFGGERPTPTDEHRWMVFAYSIETGDLMWQEEVHRGIPDAPRHLKNTYASETPVTDGQYIYAYFGNVGLFCLDMNGRVLWSQTFDLVDTRAGWGTAASPVLHGDRLYLVNDNDDQSFLVALSKETGAELWRVNRDEGSNWSTPYVWENELRTELVTTGTDKVRSYDLQGQLLWELTGMSSITIATPFSRFGFLYLGSGYIGDQQRPVFAIKPGASGDISVPEDGSLDESIAWYLPQAASYNPSPIIYGDHYYTLLDRGFFTCHNARTGEEVYGRQRIRPGVAFTASPWAYRNHIFALSEDGDTYVIKAGEEFEVVAVNSLNEMSMATPAIAHSSLFIRTASKLYRIAASD